MAIVDLDTVPVNGYCRPRKRVLRSIFCAFIYFLLVNGHCRPRKRGYQWPLLTTIVWQRYLSTGIAVSNTF